MLNVDEGWAGTVLMKAKESKEGQFGKGGWDGA